MEEGKTMTLGCGGPGTVACFQEGLVGYQCRRRSPLAGVDPASLGSSDALQRCHWFCVSESARRSFLVGGHARCREPARGTAGHLFLASAFGRAFRRLGIQQLRPEPVHGWC